MKVSLLFAISCFAIFHTTTVSAQNVRKKVNPPKKVLQESVKQEPINLCQESGLLLMTADPACPMRVKTADGKNMIPIEFPENTRFENTKADQRIKFTSERIKNTNLDCDPNAECIKLLCFEIIPSSEFEVSTLPKDSCHHIIDPYSVEWMNKMIIQFKPREIIKFENLDQYAYSLRNENQTIYVDCFGNLICKHNAEKPCLSELKNLINPYTILVIND